MKLIRSFYPFYEDVDYKITLNPIETDRTMFAEVVTKWKSYSQNLTIHLKKKLIFLSFKNVEVDTIKILT